MSQVAPKLYSFNPDSAYRSRTLDELNDLTIELNEAKNKLSESIGFYLKDYESYREKYPYSLREGARLCRALAVPGVMAESFIISNHIRTHNYEYPSELKILLENLSKKSNRVFQNFLRNVVSLDGDFTEAVYADMEELLTYAKMYYDIDLVKDSLISKEYPNGNSFDHVINIMQKGAVIVRFKYISRNGSESEEKVVSYHLMNHDNQNVLGTHVQGDSKFSMSKLWGQGDNMLVPLYPEYEGTIIRWGKEQVQAALEGKQENEMELLY